METKIDSKKLLQRIDDQQWKESFITYLNWRSSSNKIYPSRKTDPNTIYHWVANNKRNLNKINIHKKRVLESVGFEIASKNSYAQRQQLIWTDMLQQYLKWRETSNGKIYPTKQDSIKLYNWTRNNRRFLTNNQISNQRKEILLSVGFTTTTSQDEHFNYWFTKLKEYKAIHRTCHIKQDINSPNYKLSRWINSMRESFHENSLKLKYVRQLESIKFSWNIVDERFLKKWRFLKKYYKQHQHFDISIRDNKKIANWVATIRCRPPKNKMYIELLNQIGFVWKGPKTRRKEALQIMYEIDVKHQIQKFKKKLAGK